MSLLLIRLRNKLKPRGPIFPTWIVALALLITLSFDNKNFVYGKPVLRERLGMSYTEVSNDFTKNTYDALLHVKESKCQTIGSLPLNQSNYSLIETVGTVGVPSLYVGINIFGKLSGKPVVAGFLSPALIGKQDDFLNLSTYEKIKAIRDLGIDCVIINNTIGKLVLEHPMLINHFSYHEKGDLLYGQLPLLGTVEGTVIFENYEWTLKRLVNDQQR